MLFWQSDWPLATDSGVRYLGVTEDITVRKKTIAHAMQLMRHGRFELRPLDEARHLAELLAYAFPDPSRTQASRLGLHDYAQKRVRVSLDRRETALRMSIKEDQCRVVAGREV